ncbi:LysR family transcriptional regulator [Roseicyclus sp. F158]|uniref:LysR family transcriptional regulator n=1 Tax=Tropicimonas omnivorans TaxID=3075590 RepID=A0ABU3DE98_9RHOB|nr:LysR family transcriptional regulator [Roseicyclus sp. F158]MDT0681447.1 LysR family transcriptional regulator [Roseicyclus sp. F158]
MRIDYLGIEAFLAIADHGSFQRAAKFLGLSQAALSHRLRKIETDLGVQLLVRSSHAISLTAAGEALLPKAGALLSQLQAVYDSVRVRQAEPTGKVAFACLPTLASALLPQVLSEIAEENPYLEIDVIEIPFREIGEKVRTGRCDFAISLISAASSDLITRPLGEEPYCAFMRNDNRLAERKSVTLEDLVEWPMVRLAPHKRSRQIIDKALEEKSSRIQWPYEVQSSALATRIVSRSTAISVLPMSAIALAPQDVVSVPIDDTRIARDLAVITRRDSTLSPAAEYVLGKVEKYVVAMTAP